MRCVRSRRASSSRTRSTRPVERDSLAPSSRNPSLFLSPFRNERSQPCKDHVSSLVLCSRCCRVIAPPVSRSFPIAPPVRLPTACLPSLLPDSQLSALPFSCSPSRLPLAWVSGGDARLHLRRTADLLLACHHTASFAHPAIGRITTTTIKKAVCALMGTSFTAPRI